MTKSKCFKCLKIFVYLIFIIWFLLILLQCPKNDDLNINIAMKEERDNPRIKFKRLIEDLDGIRKSNSELLGNPE